MVGPEVAVTSDPRFVPSIWNWTPATATVSVDDAERVIVEETMELEVGETRVTWGGVRSAGSSETTPKLVLALVFHCILVFILTGPL